jgi:hypothetical protein
MEFAPPLKETNSLGPPSDFGKDEHATRLRVNQGLRLRVRPVNLYHGVKKRAITQLLSMLPASSSTFCHIVVYLFLGPGYKLVFGFPT